MCLYIYYIYVYIYICIYIRGVVIVVGDLLGSIEMIPSFVSNSFFFFFFLNLSSFVCEKLHEKWGRKER